MNIDKGIPIPTSRTKYPFADMEVGDSFEIEVFSVSKRTSIASAVSLWSKRNGGDKKCIIRKTGENSMRIWRIK